MVAAPEIDSDSSGGDSSPRSIPLPLTSTKLSTPSLSELPASDQSRASEGSSLLGAGTPPSRQIPLTRFTPTNMTWRHQLSSASPSALRPALSVVPTRKETQEKKAPTEKGKLETSGRLPEGRILSLLRSKSKVGNFHNVTVNKEAVPQLSRPSTNAATEFISVNQSARVRPEPLGKEAKTGGERSEINVKNSIDGELTPYEVFTKNKTYTSSVKDLLRRDNVDQKELKLGYKKIGELLNEELTARGSKAVAEKPSPKKLGAKLPSKKRASSQNIGVAVSKKRPLEVALSQGQQDANDKSLNKSPKVQKNSKLQVSPRTSSTNPTVTPLKNSVSGVIINNNKDKLSLISKSTGSPLPISSRKSVPAVEQATAPNVNREEDGNATDGNATDDTNGQSLASQNEGRPISATLKKNLQAVNPSVTPAKKTVNEDNKRISPNILAPDIQSKRSPSSIKSRGSLPAGSRSVTPAKRSVTEANIEDNKGKPVPTSESTRGSPQITSRANLATGSESITPVKKTSIEINAKENAGSPVTASQDVTQAKKTVSEANAKDYKGESVTTSQNVTPAEKSLPGASAKDNNDKPPTTIEGAGETAKPVASSERTRKSPPIIPIGKPTTGSQIVTPVKKISNEVNAKEDAGRPVKASQDVTQARKTVSEAITKDHKGEPVTTSQDVTPAEKSLPGAISKDNKGEPVTTSQDVTPAEKSLPGAISKDNKGEPVTTSQDVTPAEKSLPGAIAKDNNDKPPTTIEGAEETAKPVASSERTRKSPPIIPIGRLTTGSQIVTPAKKILTQVDVKEEEGTPVDFSGRTSGLIPLTFSQSLAARGQGIAPAKKCSLEENDKGNKRELVPTNKSTRNPCPIIPKHGLTAGNKNVLSVSNNEKEDTSLDSISGRIPRSYTERNLLPVLTSGSALPAQKVDDVVAHEDGSGHQEMNGIRSVDQDKRQTKKEYYSIHPPRSAIQRTTQGRVNSRPLASMEIKWNNALAQEPPDSSGQRQALADLFTRLYQSNLLVEPDVAKPKSAHCLTDNSKQTDLIEARIVTDPELFGIEETNSKRPVVKPRDKAHHLKGAVVVNYPASPKPPTGQPVEEDKSASRVELHYLKDSEGTSSDNEEQVQKALVGSGLKKLKENASSSQRPVSHATLHENSIDGRPTSAANSFQHEDPQVERRKIDRDLALKVTATLGEQSWFKKGVLMQLVEPGIAKHLAMESHPEVSVTNNICSADNYEHSHAYYYQQLHKRSKLEFIPLRGTQSTGDERKNSQVPANVTTISETSEVPPKATTILETLKQKEPQENRPGEVWKRHWRLLLQKRSILFDLRAPSEPRKRDSKQVVQLKRIFSVEFGAQVATQLDGSVEIVISSEGSKAAEMIENILKDKEKARALSKNIRLWSIEKAYQFLDNMGIDLRDWNTTQESVTTIPTTKAPVNEIKTTDKRTASAQTPKAGAVRASDVELPPVELTIKKPLPKAFIVENIASRSTVTVGPETKTTPEPKITANTTNAVKQKPTETTAVVDKEPNQIQMKKPEVTDTDVATSDTESESDEVEEDTESIMQTASEALEKKDKQIQAARKLILALCQDSMKKELEITSLTGQLKAAQRQLNENEKMIQDYASTLVQKELQLRNMAPDK